MTERKQQVEQVENEGLSASYLEELRNEYRSQGSSAKATGDILSDEEKAIVDKIKYEGRGRNGFYWVKYKGQLVGKVTREGESNTFTSIAGVSGIRQTAALGLVKKLQEAKLVK